MTIFRFDRIPGVLLAIGFALVGWKMVTGVDREIRVGQDGMMYAHPAPSRDQAVKMHGHVVYLDKDDARGETSTMPTLMCGAFLVFLARRMKAA